MIAFYRTSRSYRKIDGAPKRRDGPDVLVTLIHGNLRLPGMYPLGSHIFCLCDGNLVAFFGEDGSTKATHEASPEDDLGHGRILPKFVKKVKYKLFKGETFQRMRKRNGLFLRARTSSSMSDPWGACLSRARVQMCKKYVYGLRV